MSFISDKEIEERTKGALAKYVVGFDCGVRYAEQKLTPLFVEFANYCFKFDKQYPDHIKTTKEVFVLWCEEREKK